jgi:hypothetical protein
MSAMEMKGEFREEKNLKDSNSLESFAKEEQLLDQTNHDALRVDYKEI